MTARWHLGPITGWSFWWLLFTSPEVLIFLFFMHLKGSDNLIWLVVGASLFWLIILFVLLLNDYVTRHLGVL